MDGVIAPSSASAPWIPARGVTRRPIEELGHYDPMCPDAKTQTVLNVSRLRYWLSVGAQPSHKVQVLLNKFGVKKPAPGEPWQVPVETAAPAAAAQPAPCNPRPRPRPAPLGDRQRDAALMPAPPAASHRRSDSVSGHPGRFLEPEHPQSGDRQGAGEHQAVGYPRLGARASTSRSTIGRLAAAREWC